MQVNDFHSKFIGRMENIETWNFCIVLAHAYPELWWSVAVSAMVWWSGRQQRTCYESV